MSIRHDRRGNSVWGRALKLAAGTDKAAILSSAPPSATPTSIALTRQPCDLLTPEVAKKYAGDDAQRQLTYEPNLPVPVGDNACYYTGSNRSVSVEAFPVPTDPTAPVNHFHVIRPENRVEGVDYEAYWFAPGGSLVAVKDGLLISVNVSNKGRRPNRSGSGRRHRTRQPGRAAGRLTPVEAVSVRGTISHF